nr:MATE family efflux transporter [uncultured Dongia sp.]
MTISQADLAPAISDRVSSRLAETRALMRLATPIALIALVNMGMSVTDTLMVSAIFGTDALAAVAVGSDLYSIVFYLCAGILGGLTPFYTAAVTRGDAGDSARLLRIGWMIVGLLALLGVPLVWFAPTWLEMFGLAPHLLDLGRGFTQAMALTLIPMLGVMLYRTVLTAAEKPKVFLKVTLAMLPLNALGNYIFMKGVGPIPALGPAGSGVSTLLVALASLAVLAVIARRATPHTTSIQVGQTLVDWHGMATVLRVGVPIGIATVTEVGIYLAATLYAATLGAADVAAHTLTLRVAGIAYAVPAALLQASMVRMARAESLGDANTRQAVIAGSLGLSAMTGTLLLGLLAGSATPLATWFFDASAAGIAAAEIAVGLLILLGLIELVANPGLAAAGLLRGRKDTRAPMVYVLIGYWAVGAPLGLYLCEIEGAGITGIWIGLATGTFVTACLSLGRLMTRRLITGRG